jgi:hypothetical protein
MRSSDAHSFGGSGRPDRRRPPRSPQARLWPGRQGHYPTLYPWAWYPLYTGAPRDSEYVWLETAHGLTRARRLDVEVRAADM